MKKFSPAYELVPAVLLFGLLAWITLSTAENIPVWDAWQYPTMIDLFHRGELSLEYLFSSSNGHRPAFPRIISLCLALASDYDVRWELLVNLFLAVCILFVFKHHAIDHSVKSPTDKTLLLTLSALMVFSFVQYENWYFGFQICYFLPIACTLLAIACLHKDDIHPLSIILARALCFIATFSLASGLLSWLVCLWVLWFRKTRLIYIAAWLFVTATVFYIYFSKAGGAKSIAMDRWPDYLTYYVRYLGSPLSISSLSKATFWGSAGLAAWVVCLVCSLKNQKDHRLFLIAVSLFALGTGVMIAVARLDFGLEYALLSRYTSFSLLFWIALCLLIHDLFFKNMQDTRSQLALLFICMVGLSVATYSVHSYKEFFKHQNRMQDAIFILSNKHHERINLDALKAITWDIDFTLAQDELLRKYQLSFYHSSE